MKKIILVLAVILVLAGFVVFQKIQSSSQMATTEPTSSSSPSSNTTSTNTPIATGGPSNSIYKDGTYTGQVASASQYGDIQVKIVISNGKILDVIFLQAPTSGGHTGEVTSMMEPILKQETIAAQSANVDVVSGATQDTEAFIQSLQSALDQAKS